MSRPDLAVPGLAQSPADMVNSESVARCWRHGLIDARTENDGTFLLHTAARAALHVRRGRLARGAGYSTAPAGARRELARLGAQLVLRTRGLYHVHAAGVVAPDGRAWLLAGESGCGKSTIAYALARAGWRVLGEDGVLLQRMDDCLIAHAWRDTLQVSIELAEYFPELRSQRAMVNWSDPRHRVPITAPGMQRAPIAALVFLNRARHDAITPLPETVALSMLVRQSSTVLLSDTCAAAHLAALRELVMQVPRFLLAHSAHQLHHAHETFLKQAR